MAVNESRIKWRAHYTRFSARNAGAASLQARPGGIRDSLRREASQAAGAAPTLRYGPAGDSAPPAAAQGGWYGRKGTFRPGKHGPKIHPAVSFWEHRHLWLSNDIK